jgi:uncharacterized protein (TIGR02246 family)
MKTFKLIFLVFLIPILNGQSVLLAQSEIKNQEIDKVWKSFISSWEKLDASACADFYWEDGLNVPPQLPENKGRDAIEVFYEGLFSQHQTSRYVHKTLMLESSGDHITEYGEFSVDWVTKDGIEWQYEARTMVYWKKNGEGLWKIKCLIFNQAP